MNTPAPETLERLKQQVAALTKYNREQRQKRENEIQLRLGQTKRP